MNIINAVRNKLRKFLDVADVKKSTEHMPDILRGAGSFMGRLTTAYFGSLREATKRTARYSEYEYLDKHLAEASATLNVYSDNVVSGAIGGAENYQVVVNKKTPNIEKIEEVVKATERRTRIKDDVWDIARDTICFGDNWEEIIIGQEKESKEFVVQKLKGLPPKQMYADVDERGVLKNAEIPYIQKQSVSDKARIEFHWWQVIHFKMGRGIYGVNRSLFSNASRRIGRQLLWIDDSMVLARLSRAYQRYAFMVDTSGLGPDEKFEFAEQFLERVRRKEIVDRSSGRISPLDAPWMPDEDIAIPVEKDSPQDIKVLAGDLRLGQIDDVRYFQEKFFMALNIPKAYVSKEEGVRAKATITQLDVQFARQVRRKQRALRPGLRQMYRVAFYLADIDPDLFEWEIVFPVLATMDELLKWEMELVKAKIAKLYGVEIGALNNLWIMEKLLEFSREEIEKYSVLAPEDMKGGSSLPTETAAMIKKDPFLRHALDDLKDLAAWKIGREQEMEDKKEIGLEREEELSDKWRE